MVQEQQSFDVFHRLDANKLSESMVESVKMVKTLMETNRELRQQIQSLQQSLEVNENESFHLQMENRECRDRIEILESVVTCSA